MQEFITYFIIVITVIYVFYKLTINIVKSIKSEAACSSCPGCTYNKKCSMPKNINTRQLFETQ